MKRLLHDIVRMVLVAILPLLLALAPAMAQTVMYQGATTPFTIVEVPGHSYEWEIYSDVTVNFAAVPGNCPITSAAFVGGNTGSTVSVKWLQTGIYFFKVTARDATYCVMNLKIGMIKVIPVELEAIITGETLTGACQSVKLDASKSIGNNIKYEWSVIDQGGSLIRQTGISTEFQVSPSFEGSQPADIRVKLQVINSNGNTNSDTITIKVDRLPIAELYSSGKLEKDGTMIVDAVITAGKALKYRWYTSEGKIIGPDNMSTANLFGAGVYTLEITDNYGCITTKNFKFPVEVYKIIANPDYARISWVQDTTINVLANDSSSVGFIPGTVRVTEQPMRGSTKVNAYGSITYIPRERQPGRDHFIYEVCDAVSLCTSATVTIDIFDSRITIPDGFSPNGDGINDRLVIGGLENYLQSKLYVYTRAGVLAYQSVDYQNDWDGTAIKNTMTNLETVPKGVYYYVLKLGGTDRVVKGFIYIAY